MASYVKFNDFVEQVLKGVHDFSSASLKVALTNIAPTAANAILTDITQIAATGGYVAGGYELDGEVLSETAGNAKIIVNDETITAAGGAVGPFRYLVIYNDTPSSPVDPLIAYYDYGSALTLNDGESLTLDFDATNGIFSLS